MRTASGKCDGCIQIHVAESNHYREKNDKSTRYFCDTHDSPFGADKIYMTKSTFPCLQSDKAGQKKISTGFNRTGWCNIFLYSRFDLFLRLSNVWVFVHCERVFN